MARLRFHTVIVSFLTLLSFSFPAPSQAWMIPGSEVLSEHVGRGAHGYHQSPHVYILQHAIRILHESGYENWAEIAGQQLHWLANGARLADDPLGTGGRMAIWGEIKLFHLISVWDDLIYDICSLASLNHFHNPSGSGVWDSVLWRDRVEPGLDLRKWKDVATDMNMLEKLLQLWAAAALITPLTGLPADPITVSFEAYVKPPMQDFYRSAADQAQEKYDSALQLYNETYCLSEAMFRLGWACHMLGDMSVTQHTYDSFIGHENYENAATGKGENTSDPQFPVQHLFVGKTPVDLRALMKLSATEMAFHVAQAVHTEEQYQWAEGEGSAPTEGFDMMAFIKGDQRRSNHPMALKKALQAAELYTAALIAKFMAEAGVPEKVPVLRGAVYAGKQPLAGAYVFYAPIRPGFSSDFVPWWDCVRTDEKGHYSLDLKPNVDYLMRPAMPGYDFTGSYLITSQQDQWGTLCPVPYRHTGAMASRTLNFYLSPWVEPNQQQLAKAPQDFAAQVRPNVEALLDPSKKPFPGFGLYKVPTGSIPEPVVPSGTPMPLSKEVLSPAMAQKVSQALLEVKHITTGLLQWPSPNSDLAEPLYDNVMTTESSSERPHEAYAQLQVSHLLALDQAQPQLLVQTPDIVKVIDLRRAQWAAGALKPPLMVMEGKPKAAGRALTKSAKAEEVDMNRPDIQAIVQRVDSIKKALPKSKVQGPDGKLAEKPRLPVSAAGLPIKDSLLFNGLLPVPAPAGVKLEVAIKPGPGYLGSPSIPPLILTTDNTGRAAFFLHAGSHAGTIRVFVKVVQDSHVQYRPETALEFHVRPQLGPDVTPVKHPTLSTAPVVDPADPYAPPQNWHRERTVAAQPPVMKSGRVRGVPGQLAGTPDLKTIPKIPAPGNAAMTQETAPGEAGQKTQISMEGRWSSSILVEYDISQTGDRFTWTAPQLNQQGAGILSGQEVSTRWRGPNDAGTAEGRITEVDATGKATRIEWDNGVVLFRGPGPSPAPSPPPAEQKKIVAKQLEGLQVQGLKVTPQLSGTWESSIRIKYEIIHRGESFTWTASQLKQQASGRVSGKEVSAKWRGEGRPGAAKGRITQMDKDGRATRIEWDNGVVFFR